jgi:hypothetical protein
MATRATRPRLPWEAPDHEGDSPLQALLPGYVAPVLPDAVQGTPALAAQLAEVIRVDLTEEISWPGTIAVAGTSAAKGGGGGGGGGGSGGGGSGGLLTSYTSQGAYNVNIVFNGTWTAELQAVFVNAANRISQIIVADIPAVSIRGAVIDDIRITAELKAIDGTGGVLGQAGPTALRTGSYLPATAMMQFDSADAAGFNSQGLFDEIVTHEMLHAIGVGSIWSYKGLVSGASFIGANAMAAYDDLVDAFNGFENGVEALPVPLESGGGSGTAGSHWSEAVFNTELMTGYIDTAPANGTVADPLSAMTIASLKDLGYGVSFAQADTYYLA